MKKHFKVIMALAVYFVVALSFIACQKTADSDVWSNATYTEAKAFGNGSKTVEVQVIVGDNSVIFTLNTDAETLGEALLEHGLISGDESEFGLYVKVVNGITADYDIDASYWSFTQNGEYMMTGVDGTAISDGDRYELTYTK